MEADTTRGKPQLYYHLSTASASVSSYGSESNNTFFIRLSWGLSELLNAKCLVWYRDPVNS